MLTCTVPDEPDYSASPFTRDRQHFEIGVKDEFPGCVVDFDAGSSRSADFPMANIGLTNSRPSASI